MIEDNLNHINYNFCRRLIDSVKKRTTNTWISLKKVFAAYYNKQGLFLN